MLKDESQKGSVTLETSIVLPIFIVIILFVYGLFSIVSAQNQVSHALIQSSKSLSLDSYLTENVESAAEAGTSFWGGLSNMVEDLARMSNDQHFSSMTDWYSTTSAGANVAKDRFVGYLSGGDESAANEKLENMGVVNGLSGITFETNVAGEELTITIKYQLQYWFDAFDLGKIPMEQTITTRLWK